MNFYRHLVSTDLESCQTRQDRARLNLVQVQHWSLTRGLGWTRSCLPRPEWWRSGGSHGSSLWWHRCDSTTVIWYEIVTTWQCESWQCDSTRFWEFVSVTFMKKLYVLKVWQFDNVNVCPCNSVTVQQWYSVCYVLQCFSVTVWQHDMCDSMTVWQYDMCDCGTVWHVWQVWQNDRVTVWQYDSTTVWYLCQCICVTVYWGPLAALKGINMRGKAA